MLRITRWRLVDPAALATPSSARLLASVAQPVKTISLDCAPISSATWARAVATASAARLP
jgi:hypothetical protein